MNTRKTEILVGLFIAAGLAALFMLAMKVSNLNIYSNDDGIYHLTGYNTDLFSKIHPKPLCYAIIKIANAAALLATER